MNKNRSTVCTIEILHLIASSPNVLTITEVSQVLGIPKSTTHQIIQSLHHLRMMENSRSKTFRRGIRFFEMALPAFANMDLRREAKSILEDLSLKTRESLFMAKHSWGNAYVALPQQSIPL